jgi:hypothetical protein
MSDNEEFIRITAEDIAQANQLSLNCPICAGAVEKHTANQEAAPVYCVACETLYHHACWEQNGGSCAVLGCDGAVCKRYGVVDLGPALRIEPRDIPKEAPRPVVSPNGQTKRLKEDERLRGQIRIGSFWRNLWHNLLQAIKLWPSDPS